MKRKINNLQKKIFSVATALLMTLTLLPIGTVHAATSLNDITAQVNARFAGFDGNTADYTMNTLQTSFGGNEAYGNPFVCASWVYDIYQKAGVTALWSNPSLASSIDDMAGTWSSMGWDVHQGSTGISNAELESLPIGTLVTWPNHAGIWMGVSSDGYHMIANMINTGNRFAATEMGSFGSSAFHSNPYNYYVPKFNKNLTVNIDKVSSNPDMTNGSSCYSLAGAQFHIYDGSTLLGTVTTDASGKASGTYSVASNVSSLTVKESVASKGYALNTSSYTATYTGSNDSSATVTVPEKPLNDPIGITLTKQQSGAITNGNIASLAGAQFTVKYYNGDYTESNLPANATRTWVIETQYKSLNGRYEATLDDAHKVSGDDLYKTPMGNPTIPLGTITVQETKAPDGYSLDGTLTVSGSGVVLSASDMTIFNIKIGSDGDAYMYDKDGNISGNSISATNEYTKNEDIFYGTFDFYKNDAEYNRYAQGDTNLSASFKLINASNTTTNNGIAYYDKNGDGTFTSDEAINNGDTVLEFTTDATGHYTLPNHLSYGSYRIVETNAPTGYTLNGITETTFNISDENNDGKSGDVINVTGLDSNGNKTASQRIEDNVITGNFDITKTLVDGSSSFDNKKEAGVQFTAILASKIGTGKAFATWDDAYNAINAVGNNQTIKDVNGNILLSKHEYSIITTDENGYAESSDLAYGTYIIKQTSNYPESEPISGNTTFTVSTEGQHKSFDATNGMTHYYIQLTKLDEITGKKVASNATQFQLTLAKKYVSGEGTSAIYMDVPESEQSVVTMSSQGKVYSTYQTADVNNTDVASGVYKNSGDASVLGEVTTPDTLVAGVYKVSEIKTANGFYDLSGNDTYVTVQGSMITETDSYGNHIIAKNIENTPILGNLDITKVIDKDFVCKTNTTVTDALDSDVFSKLKFTLLAKEDIINPDDGSVLVQKGNVAIDLNGNTIGNVSLDSDGKASVSNIPLGNYTIHEDTGNTGLAASEDTDVEFKSDSSVSKTDYSIGGKYYDDVNKSITLHNKPTDTVVTKRNATNGGEITGAELTVSDSTGKIVDSWTSQSNIDHHILGLKPDETYTLTENIAPGAYSVAKSVDFKVKSDGTVTNVTMVDTLTSIAKTDADGKLIDGATLNVKDETGKVLDTWTTGEQIVTLTSDETNKLVNGEPVVKTVNGIKYTVYAVVDTNVTSKDVVKASDNTLYDKNGCAIDTKTDEISDKVDTTKGTITYRVKAEKEDGTVAYYNVDKTGKETTRLIAGLTVGNSYTVTETGVPSGYVKANPVSFTAIGDDDATVTMIDKKLLVKKSDATTGKEIDGAKLTVSDEKGTVIDTWTSSKTEEHSVTGLEVGKTYKLTEVVAPFGYNMASDITFKVTDDGIDQTVEMKDEAKPVYIRVAKSDAGNVSYYLKGAEITIYDESGKVAKTLDGKDAVGVTDENGQVSLNLAYEQDNTYYAKETKAPDGYFVNDAKFDIVVSDKYTFASTDLITINVYDEAMSIVDSAVNTYIPVAFGLGVGFGACLYFVLKKKKHTKN